jgi:hypothetical protein
VDKNIHIEITVVIEQFGLLYSGDIDQTLSNIILSVGENISLIVSRRIQA